MTTKDRKVRVGLLPKIVLFLLATLVPLAAVSWYLSVQTLPLDVHVQPGFTVPRHASRR